MKNVFSKTEPELIPCENNYSFFFDFIEREVPGPKTKPFHRICTFMRKMKVKCFVKEQLEPDLEIKGELAAISARAGKPVTASANRFTFFRRTPPDGAWKSLDDEDILGYAVLLKIDPPLEIPVAGIPDKKIIHGYILEAVIIPPAVVLDNGAVEAVGNYYVHTCKEFETTIGKAGDNKSFHLVGTFYCQQNGFTNACAHAALRMAINSWERYKGPKLTYEDINKILKVDHAGFLNRPNGGLSSTDMDKVIRQLGFQTDVAHFAARMNLNYEEYIYPIVESGCPVILGLSKALLDAQPDDSFGHVVAVVGHTLNSDRWAEAKHGYGTVPNSHYISAAAWADHFIVNDDNFGMYVTLPTEAVKNIIVPKYNPNLSASVGIGIIPEKPSVDEVRDRRITGYGAEQTASILLRKLIRDLSPTDFNRWFKLLKTGNHTPVLRTIYREKGDYLKALAEMTDERGNKLHNSEVTFVERLLPERMWITEVMAGPLYIGNKRKLGDVVLKTSESMANIRAGKVCVFAWLPGVRWNGSLLQSGPEQWSILGHVPLLRGIPAKHCKLEW